MGSRLQDEVFLRIRKAQGWTSGPAATYSKAACNVLCESSTDAEIATSIRSRLLTSNYFHSHAKICN
jgi:hypothetical protein